jgi:hypothetical protein
MGSIARRNVRIVAGLDSMSCQDELRDEAMTKPISKQSVLLIALSLTHCGGAEDVPAGGDVERVDPADAENPDIVRLGKEAGGTTLIGTLPEGDEPMLGGGQTGDDSGTTGLDCDVVGTTLLGLDDISPLGFVPNDSLALALGSSALPLRWLSPVFAEDGELLDYVTRSTSELQLTVERSGEQARLIERVDSEHGVRCQDLLEVDVSAALASADGALSERFDATVSLRPGFAALESFIPTTALGGSFEFEPPELDGSAPSGLLVNVAFTRYGQSGALRQGYGSSPQYRPSAEWPNGRNCDVGGVTPVLHEQVTPTLEDVVSAVRVSPLTLINAAGERAPATLTLEATPDTACHCPAAFARRQSSLDELTLEAVLTLESSALPAPIRLPLRVLGWIDPNGTTIESAALSMELTPCGTNSYHGPGDFIENCGDWGVDVSASTSAFLEITESTFAAGTGYTLFRILGLTFPGCTPGPMGYVCSEQAGEPSTRVLGEVRLVAE